MCGAVTFGVPLQCRACGIMQIYPHQIYYYKEQGYDSQVPAEQGFNGWKFVVPGIPRRSGGGTEQGGGEWLQMTGA